MLTYPCITLASTAEGGDLDSHELFLPFKIDGVQILEPIPIHKDQTETEETRYKPTEVLAGSDDRLPKKVKRQLLSFSADSVVGAEEQKAYLDSWALSHVPFTYNGLNLGTGEEEWPLHFSYGGDQSELKPISDEDAMNLD